MPHPRLSSVGLEIFKLGVSQGPGAQASSLLQARIVGLRAYTSRQPDTGAGIAASTPRRCSRIWVKSRFGRPLCCSFLPPLSITFVGELFDAMGDHPSAL